MALRGEFCRRTAPLMSKNTTRSFCLSLSFLFDGVQVSEVCDENGVLLKALGDGYE